MVYGVRRVTGSREYLFVLGGLAAGAVGCIVLAGATWGTAEVTGVLGTDQVRITGSELVPIAEAAGWLGLAAVVAIHAARGFGRAVVGALLAVAGVAVAAWAGWRAVSLDTAVETATTGDAVPTLISTNPAAAIATAAAGALVAAAGLLTVLRGSRWPAMGRKYERPDPAGAGGTGTARDAWDALDRGDDPTTWLRDSERTRQNETDATNGPGRPTRP